MDAVVISILFNVVLHIQLDCKYHENRGMKRVEVVQSSEREFLCPSPSANTGLIIWKLIAAHHAHGRRAHHKVAFRVP